MISCWCVSKSNFDLEMKIMYFPFKYDVLWDKCRTCLAKARFRKLQHMNKNWIHDKDDTIFNQIQYEYDMETIFDDLSAAPGYHIVTIL